METSTIPLGTVVGGDFRVERVLGEGGMGTVFVAEQLSTSRQRALKVLAPRLAGIPRVMERFDQEARVGAKIESDHVVEVISAGIDPNLQLPFLVMELLDGQNLEEYIDTHGTQPAWFTAEVFRQLSHALGRAHQMNIVHRDLKPENLFLARPRRAGEAFVVKVLDFGIAKVLAEARTAGTAAVGTPVWMAPEQTTNNGQVFPSTDVWALGLMAFWLLTGRHYYVSMLNEHVQAYQVIRECLQDPLVPASERAERFGIRGVSVGFDTWFAQCVDRDPGRRFQTGNAACDALVRLLESSGVAPGLSYPGEPTPAPAVVGAAMGVAASPNPPTSVVGGQSAFEAHPMGTHPGAIPPTVNAGGMPAPPQPTPQAQAFQPIPPTAPAGAIPPTQPAQPAAEAPLGPTGTLAGQLPPDVAQAAVPASSQAAVPAVPQAPPVTRKKRKGKSGLIAVALGGAVVLAALATCGAFKLSYGGRHNACAEGSWEGCAQACAGSTELKRVAATFGYPEDCLRAGQLLDRAAVGSNDVELFSADKLDLSRAALREKAVKAYRLACDAKVWGGCAGLAALEEEGVQVGHGGQPTERNLEKAYDNYGKACDGGSEQQDACTRHARARALGLGVVAEVTSGRDDLDSLCEAGQGKACYALVQSQPSLDEEERHKTLMHGCDARDADSCLALAEDPPPDRDGEADEWRTRAKNLATEGCDGGDISACVTMARAAGDGLDGKQRARLVAACSAGAVSSCHHLAGLFNEGKSGFDKSETRARALWEAACKGGEPAACMRVSRYQDARAMWTKACDWKHAPACVALGLEIHVKGLGASKNASNAVHPLQTACDIDPMYCAQLAQIHETEESVRDLEKAKKLYKKACDVQSGPACAKLGSLHQAAEDRDAAAQAFERGCELGVADSCLGVGAVLPAEDERARAALATACDMGRIDGCLGAADAYQSTDPKDLEKAEALFRKACNLKSDQTKSRDGCAGAAYLAIKKDKGKEWAQFCKDNKDYPKCAQGRRAPRPKPCTVCDGLTASERAQCVRLRCR